MASATTPAGDTPYVVPQLPPLLRALIEPGTGLILVPYINMSLVALFVTLIVMGWMRLIPTIHLVVMGCLAGGLGLSLRWFVSIVTEGGGGVSNTAGEGPPADKAEAPKTD